MFTEQWGSNCQTLCQAVRGSLGKDSHSALHGSTKQAKAKVQSRGSLDYDCPLVLRAGSTVPRSPNVTFFSSGPAGYTHTPHTLPCPTTHTQVTSCVPTTEQFPMTRLSQLYLKVLKATGEVQDVPQVSLGIPAGARGLPLLQLLSDCIELQGSDGEDLASPQELFSCNSHSPRGEPWVPAPLCGQGTCPPGQQ